MHPRDSKMHSVERVMSALNEAAGDGTFIDVRGQNSVPGDWRRTAAANDEQVLQCSLKFTTQVYGSLAIAT